MHREFTQWLDESGYTKSDLASILCVNVKNVQSWYRGDSRPDWPTRVAVWIASGKVVDPRWGE
jgi:DNA-binding transcriptional regulator YiaG